MLDPPTLLGGAVEMDLSALERRRSVAERCHIRTGMASETDNKTEVDRR